MLSMKSFQQNDQSKHAVIDNFVFRLHFRLTLPILTAMSFFVAGYQYFGRSINCVPIDNFPSEFINSYCYVHSTYGTEEYWADVVKERVHFPEVSKLYPDEPRIYHTYYKWVSLVLFLQAIACYLPKYFWTAMESGRVTELVELIKTPSAATELLMSNLLLPSNRKYLLCYSLAEITNAVCALCHIYITNVFLGGGYYLYGLHAIRFAVHGGENPMTRLFPKIAMCSYQPGGLPDSTEPYTTTCLLPTNVLNEKIYLFLWFLFVLQSVLSCLAVFYRTIFYMSNRIRMLNMNSNLVEKQVMEMVLKKLSAGDCFLIHLLSMNVSSVIFRDFILIVFGEIGNMAETQLVELEII